MDLTDMIAEHQDRPDFPPPIAEHDGCTVKWDRQDGWELEVATTLRFHADTSCEQCGYTGRKWIQVGRVYPREGETFETTRLRRANRSGRMYAVNTEVSAWPVWRLVAFLCPPCRDLRVLDMNPGEGGPVEIRPT